MLVRMLFILPCCSALAEDAERAVASKHGSSLDGRTIKAEVAKKRAPFEERKTKRREPGRR